MAQRRMFSKQIVETDAFLDMPKSSQLLYFHLNMEADDDGFVSSPKKVMRIIGSSDDDYKILLAKRFILEFDGGICVIKHWLIHNYIRKDTYVETKYLKEKSLLRVKENRSYTERGRAVDEPSTQCSVDKISIDKIREENSSSSFKKTKRFYKPTGEEMRFSKGKWWVLPKSGGEWLLFAGKLEVDTELKQYERKNVI